MWITERAAVVKDSLPSADEAKEMIKDIDIGELIKPRVSKTVSRQARAGISLPVPAQMIVAELAGYDVLGALGYPHSAEWKRGVNQHNRNRASVAEVARRLGKDKGIIKKVAKAYIDGGDAAVEKVKLGKGRPLKLNGLTREQMDEAVSVPRLLNEAGMPLAAKAITLSSDTGK